MISMHGVESSLIARHQSWVRQQARALARRLPSNVEQADLIQAGLIAVAQAALSFAWPDPPGLPGSEAAEAAHAEFLRYARHRVRGAMLDELRQMDRLSRAQRRKIKVMQIARERWMAQHSRPMGLVALAEATGMSLQEITWLDQIDALTRADAQPAQAAPWDEGLGAGRSHTPSAWAAYATGQDEVEARVDTSLLLQRLEGFFASLPEAERQLIDAYLGVGLNPVDLADTLALSRSGLSRRTAHLLGRAARFLERSLERSVGGAERATDRTQLQDDLLSPLLRQREAALQAEQGLMGAHVHHPPQAWSAMLADVLKPPPARVGGGVVIPLAPHTRYTRSAKP